MSKISLQRNKYFVLHTSAYLRTWRDVEAQAIIDALCVKRKVREKQKRG